MKKMTAIIKNVYRSKNGNDVFVYALPKRTQLPENIIHREDEAGNVLIFSTRWYGKSAIYIVNEDTNKAYFDSSSTAIEKAQKAGQLRDLVDIVNKVTNDPAEKATLLASLASNVMSSQPAAPAAPIQTPAPEQVQEEGDEL